MDDEHADVLLFCGRDGCEVDGREYPRAVCLGRVVSSELAIDPVISARVVTDELLDARRIAIAPIANCRRKMETHANQNGQTEKQPRDTPLPTCQLNRRER